MDRVEEGRYANMENVCVRQGKLKLTEHALVCIYIVTLRCIFEGDSSAR